VVFWRDGVNFPVEPWTAPDDREACPACKGAGEKDYGLMPDGTPDNRNEESR
jgi:hypothetical protein